MPHFTYLKYRVARLDCNYSVTPEKFIANHVGTFMYQDFYSMALDHKIPWKVLLFEQVPTSIGEFARKHASRPL